MHPVKFKGSNIIFGENQPEYQPLPAFLDEEGTVVTVWKLSLWERIRVLFTGRLYMITMTFKSPVQPMLPTINNPMKTHV